MLYVVQKKSEARHADVPSFYDRIVPTLITKTVLGCITDGGEKPHVLGNDSVLEITGRLINLIVRTQDISKQEVILQDAFDLFIRNKSSGLIQQKQEDVVNTFKPFGSDVVAHHAPCMVLFSCIVAGIKKEV